MISTLKRIRVSKPKLLIKNNPSASLFIHVLISIFCLHMFSRKYALFELEVYAVLAQNFRKKMALNLLNELKNRVAEDEVPFVCRVSM